MSGNDTNEFEGLTEPLGVNSMAPAPNFISTACTAAWEPRVPVAALGEESSASVSACTSSVVSTRPARGVASRRKSPSASAVTRSANAGAIGAPQFGSPKSSLHSADTSLPTVRESA